MNVKTDYLIVDMPVCLPEPRLLPALILGNRPCLEQIAFVGSLASRGWSPSTIQRATTAIGRFHDFWTFALHGVPVPAERMPTVLEQFAAARYRGTVNAKGDDPSGLFWPRRKLSTAAMDLDYVSRFFDFCATEFSWTRANPTVLRRVSWAERMSELARRGETDLLGHLYLTTRKGRGWKRQRVASLNARPSDQPREDRPRPSPSAVERLVFESPSLRDELLWFLLAYGGIRVSEALNLFVDDVTVDAQGAAIVRLKHPVYGVDERVETRTGRVQRVDRQTFLRRHYGLVPRSLLPKNHPLHAGWKGMLWDDTRAEESVVHWLTPEYGRLFWILHERYMLTTRAHVPDVHPYYFVSTNREQAGMPLKLGCVRHQFRRASKRVGLGVEEGAGRIHSLRHFYAWVNSVIGGVPPQYLRRRMHQKTLTATNIYGPPSILEMNAELADAFGRMDSSLNPTRRKAGADV